MKTTISPDRIGELRNYLSDLPEVALSAYDVYALEDVTAFIEDKLYEADYARTPPNERHYHLWRSVLRLKRIVERFDRVPSVAPGAGPSRDLDGPSGVV